MGSDLAGEKKEVPVPVRGGKSLAQDRRRERGCRKIDAKLKSMGRTPLRPGKK